MGCAEGGTADIDDIGEALEFDGAIDAEVRDGAGGQRTIEFAIHGAGTVDDGSVDAGDVSRARFRSCVSMDAFWPSRMSLA